MERDYTGLVFDIYRRTGPDGVDRWISMSTQAKTEYIDTTVEPGVIYYYTVRAVDPKTKQVLGTSNLDAGNSLVATVVKETTTTYSPTQAITFDYFRYQDDGGCQSGDRLESYFDDQNGLKINHCLRTASLGSGASFVADATLEPNPCGLLQPSRRSERQSLSLLEADEQFEHCQHTDYRH